jgi:hypothetical protein
VHKVHISFYNELTRRYLSTDTIVLLIRYDTHITLWPTRYGRR